jgi:hypothetical protein
MDVESGELGETVKNEMELDEDDVSSQSPFPPFPSREDERLLDEQLLEAQVPSWETQVEELIPQTAVAELKPSESLYYKQISFEEACESFLSDYLESPALPIKQHVEAFDMDQLLFETFEHLSMDSKTKPPMSAEDLLTLFSFRTSYGVPIPENNSSGYESKSIINDLLILRLPALHTLFGGDRILDHEIRVQEELAALQKGRRREKERDSGQGKAPVKMSAAKLAKKRAADIAAGRIPADEMKLDELKVEIPNTPDDRFSESAASMIPPSVDSDKAKLKSPMKSPAEKIDCICANAKVDYGLFMVSCDECEVWFHGHCVNVLHEVPNWLCPRCL